MLTAEGSTVAVTTNIDSSGMPGGCSTSLQRTVTDYTYVFIESVDPSETSLKDSFLPSNASLPHSTVLTSSAGPPPSASSQTAHPTEDTSCQHPFPSCFPSSSSDIKDIVPEPMDVSDDAKIPIVESKFEITSDDPSPTGTIDNMKGRLDKEPMELDSEIPSAFALSSELALKSSSELSVQDSSEITPDKSARINYDLRSPIPVDKKRNVDTIRERPRSIAEVLSSDGVNDRSVIFTKVSDEIDHSNVAQSSHVHPSMLHEEDRDQAPSIETQKSRQLHEEELCDLKRVLIDVGDVPTVSANISTESLATTSPAVDSVYTTTSTDAIMSAFLSVDSQSSVVCNLPIERALPNSLDIFTAPTDTINSIIAFDSLTTLNNLLDSSVHAVPVNGITAPLTVPPHLSAALHDLFTPPPASIAINIKQVTIENNIVDFVNCDPVSGREMIKIKLEVCDSEMKVDTRDFGTTAYATTDLSKVRVEENDVEIKIEEVEEMGMDFKIEEVKDMVPMEAFEPDNSVSSSSNCSDVFQSLLGMEVDFSETIVPTGDLLVPTGVLVVPTGDLLVPTGDFLVPTGYLVVPKGDLLVPVVYLEPNKINDETSDRDTDSRNLVEGISDVRDGNHFETSTDGERRTLESAVRIINHPRMEMQFQPVSSFPVEVSEVMNRECPIVTCDDAGEVLQPVVKPADGTQPKDDNRPTLLVLLNNECGIEVIDSESVMSNTKQDNDLQLGPFSSDGLHRSCPLSADSVQTDPISADGPQTSPLNADVSVCSNSITSPRVVNHENILDESKTLVVESITGELLESNSTSSMCVDDENIQEHINVEQTMIPEIDITSTETDVTSGIVAVESLVEISKLDMSEQVSPVPVGDTARTMSVASVSIADSCNTTTAVTSVMFEVTSSDHPLPTLVSSLTTAVALSDMTEGALGGTQLTSDTTEIKYDTTEVTCDTTEVTCDTSEVMFNTPEVKCDTAVVICDTAEVIYDTAEVMCSTAEVTRDTAEVMCDTAEVMCDTAVVTRATAVVTCGTAEVTCDTSELNSDTNAVTSNVIAVTSDTDTTAVTTDLTSVTFKTTEMSSQAVSITPAVDTPALPEISVTTAAKCDSNEMTTSCAPPVTSITSVTTSDVIDTQATTSVVTTITSASDTVTRRDTADVAVRYQALMEMCIKALGICLARFPQHFKSLYRLAYLYFHSNDFKVCAAGRLAGSLVLSLFFKDDSHCLVYKFYVK